MQNTTDREMLKWWGQYIESSGDMDAALDIYQKAEDCYSQVNLNKIIYQNITTY